MCAGRRILAMSKVGRRVRVINDLLFTTRGKRERVCPSKQRVACILIVAVHFDIDNYQLHTRSITTKSGPVLDPALSHTRPHEHTTLIPHTTMAPSKAELRAASLAKIRALRASGKTAFDTYQVEEAEDLYETVDEEGYKKVVRNRLDQDDFVVDDNGEGYADDGREDWQNEQQAYDDSESDGDLPKHSKAGKCDGRRNYHVLQHTC
jgi:hypothetical protein